MRFDTISELNFERLKSIKAHLRSEKEGSLKSTIIANKQVNVVYNLTLDKIKS